MFHHIKLNEAKTPRCTHFHPQFTLLHAHSLPSCKPNISENVHQDKHATAPPWNIPLGENDQVNLFSIRMLQSPCQSFWLFKEPLCTQPHHMIVWGPEPFELKLLLTGLHTHTECNSPTKTMLIVSWAWLPSDLWNMLSTSYISNLIEITTAHAPTNQH